LDPRRILEDPAPIFIRSILVDIGIHCIGYSLLKAALIAIPNESVTDITSITEMNCLVKQWVSFTKNCVAYPDNNRGCLDILLTMGYNSID
jgi:hypothetical protein